MGEICTLRLFNQSEPRRLVAGSVLLILGLALFAASCTPIDPPTATFDHYDIKGIGLTRSDIEFYFNVENPNTVPLGLKEITYDIALDGAELVSGTIEGFDLNAREKKMVAIPIQIVYASMAGQAANIAVKFIKREMIKYSIKGELTVTDRTVNFSVKAPLQAEGELKLFQ